MTAKHRAERIRIVRKTEFGKFGLRFAHSSFGAEFRLRFRVRHQFGSDREASDVGQAKSPGLRAHAFGQSVTVHFRRIHRVLKLVPSVRLIIHFFHAHDLKRRASPAEYGVTNGRLRNFGRNPRACAVRIAVIAAAEQRVPIRSVRLLVGLAHAFVLV